jgi:hypothetical protein
VIQQLYALGFGMSRCPAISPPDGTAGTPIPAATCAQLLQDYLTINPLLVFFRSKTNWWRAFSSTSLRITVECLHYDSRQYLASARLDHRISEKDQLFVRYNYGHALEESPDVQSLTGYSRGSAVHTYNDTLLAHGSTSSARAPRMKYGRSIATTTQT